MSTIWTFDGVKNMYNVYRGEDCMKMFCESLSEQVMKIINFEKKKIMPLKKNSVNDILVLQTVTCAKKCSNIKILMTKITVKLRPLTLHR